MRERQLEKTVTNKYIILHSETGQPLKNVSAMHTGENFGVGYLTNRYSAKNSNMQSLGVIVIENVTASRYIHRDVTTIQEIAVMEL